MIKLAMAPRMHCPHFLKGLLRTTQKQKGTPSVRRRPTDAGKLSKPIWYACATLYDRIINTQHVLFTCTQLHLDPLSAKQHCSNGAEPTESCNVAAAALQPECWLLHPCG
jgi:hypothetical protein